MIFEFWGFLRVWEYERQPGALLAKTKSGSKAKACPIARGKFDSKSVSGKFMA